ncbi:MAG: hypothetical protein A2383_00675 [Candidatus Pacebacteria bacterium RIFOXYB1_FULL_39_46]|nr:MAG: hypothetical protein A2182_00505 [Candidatus Pacebacteria bacterium RIFOXYA1_FULL_38_18]OGJ38101.1 MAG: hypothetical protein A2383_00675 [Candidatus Pacebacteria bacterium RIFOXYB1_FULL_39_46]OGJ39678.1 MAG: hypothetical protein A2411_02770 [Candidatus Pacebacteria bacterium RIFOXYC1_FULL_39_21]OGJ39853.1 MAG: hypothetical protein A2582_00440 [Candidatus Pacebacteria bacterium RIFOXYD1_FULL_39_27]
MAKKFDDNTMIKRMQGIVYKEVEGVFYILNYQTVTLHTLNETASFVWKELAKPKTIKQLTETIVDNFSTTKTQAKQDLEKFIIKYKKLGFLELI